MSESPQPRSLIRDWIEFEGLRKELEEHVKEIELSNFNLHYSSKSEAEFRGKLRRIRILLDRIERLLGPPGEEPAMFA